MLPIASEAQQWDRHRREPSSPGHTTFRTGPTAWVIGCRVDHMVVKVFSSETIYPLPHHQGLPCPRGSGSYSCERLLEKCPQVLLPARRTEWREIGTSLRINGQVSEQARHPLGSCVFVNGTYFRN